MIAVLIKVVLHKGDVWLQLMFADGTPAGMPSTLLAQVVTLAVT